jgi:HlyD family secretion protein
VELEPFDLLDSHVEAQQLLAQAVATYEKVATGFRVEEVAQANARRMQIQADFDKLRNGPRPKEISAAEADLRLANAGLNLAQKVSHRVESSYGKRAIDRNALDEATAKFRIAQAAVDATTQQLALIEEGSRAEDIARAEAQLDEAELELKLRQHGYRTEEFEEARSKRDAFEAAVRAIERQLAELRISATTDSVVEDIDLQPGDLLAANAPAITLVDRRRMWVRAYVPENHLHLTTGQEVKVRIDSFPGQTFKGEIVFAARQAEFTPANVQTPEERSKQVFRIKVKLKDGLDVLWPGMAADVVLPKPSGQL